MYECQLKREREKVRGEGKGKGFLLEARPVHWSKKRARGVNWSAAVREKK